MKNSASKLLIIAAVAALTCIFTTHVQAATITGSISFFGSASSNNDSAGGGNTTVTFSNPFSVIAAAGDYAGTTGQAATLTNFTFSGDGASATLVGGAVIPEWTFTYMGKTYSFDLLTLTNGHTEDGSMSFSGTGTAHITGFMNTFASWSLSGSGSSNNYMFSFATTTATGAAVPEGGATVALLGVGLVGIGLARRKLVRA